ncbi:MAG: prepilin-type N-terminal cleavage/methylation domain-containing protein [Phycisphaerae bacterium]
MDRTVFQRAFSLIELLLVISVLSLLVGLLAPALASARRESRRVRCLANLRSLAAGSAAYSADDPRDLLLPVHPTADRNTLYDDGFFDFGGASGAADLWDGRVGPNSDRAAATRPLNRVLGLSGGTSSFAPLFHCPSDAGHNAPADYSKGDGIVWDDSFRRRSVFASVGTSYWGNALKGRLGAADEDPGEDPSVPWQSFSVFLRPSTRIPSTSETVLYMEMPALFDVSFMPGAHGVRFFSYGLAGWHSGGPRFNFAFCDGRAETAAIPYGWMADVSRAVSPADYEARKNGVRFDCFPDAPIVDPPVGADAKPDAGDGGES